MGEHADEAIDRMIFGTRRKPTNRWAVICTRCGMAGLKWRADGDGWRLYENEKIEHNRLKPHICNAASLDDFDTVD
jgi:hypothetical protein